MRRAILSGVALALALALAWWVSPASRVDPVVHVLPYVQPGDGHTLTGTDVKVIHWLTDQTPGAFVVEFFEEGGPVQTVTPNRVPLDFTADQEEPKTKTRKDPEDDPGASLPSEKEQHFFRYTAKLNGLPFDSDITYRVKLGDKVIRQATFRTRARADKSIRCVLVGDMAQGSKAQKQIAYRISLEKPEFLIALGDIVYPSGRVNQYLAYFWGTYNDVADPGMKTGAPLMAGVPFYPVLGNHDVSAQLTVHTPDALGVYLFFSPPKNGPGFGPWNTPVDVNGPLYKDFRTRTGDSFPYIDTYSFDNGPAHFVVLNGNRPLTDPALQQWLVDDLKSSKAMWKLICYHQPGFHSSLGHYAEQRARQLQPIFEKYRVAMAFAGHVHNYQRTVPIKFVPQRVEKKSAKSTLVNGEFTLDRKFDGVHNTRPDGVIHVVAGGGGAGLYGPGLQKSSAQLKKSYGPDNYVDFTARMVVDKHSFVVLDLSPSRLTLRTLDTEGEVLDRMTITKR